MKIEILQFVAQAIDEKRCGALPDLQTKSDALQWVFNLIIAEQAEKAKREAENEADD